jgi:hypothetical protein
MNEQKNLPPDGLDLLEQACRGDGPCGMCVGVIAACASPSDCRPRPLGRI